jgi:hypothetical protein
MNMKKKLKQLEKTVKKNFGKRCPDFHYACWVCMIYMALDILKDAMDDKRLFKHSHKL